MSIVSENSGIQLNNQTNLQPHKRPRAGGVRAAKITNRANTGVPNTHLEKMADVTCRKNIVFGIRTVSALNGELILEGYSSKDLNVKPKSADWPPMDGCIHVKQEMSKLESGSKDQVHIMDRIFRARELSVGEGFVSGYIACFLAFLSFLSVIAFNFPEYLTTPELRQQYDVELLRLLLFYALVMAGSLGLLNFVRNKNKRLGAVAWIFVVLAISLGGHRVEVGDFPDHTPYIGLDWFIIDLLGSTLIFILIEKLFQFRKQAIFRPKWRIDFNYFFLNHLLIGFTILVANQFSNRMFGWAVNTDTQAWISSLSFLIQLSLLLLVADLIQYAAHRVYHEVPLFWRFHAVHHSVKHMDWLAGSRQHVIELLLTRSLVSVPLFLFGFDKSVIDAYVIIVSFHSVLNHANVHINIGWLRYIFVTPQFHHWHHSSDEVAIDRNYAAYFSFIDYLFGTAVTGEKEWPVAYGVKGDYVPDGMLKQQLFPFTRKR
jgi:sterol desaturase/sphingolipid hydroxylase (fatty acid hydroxylase superfamily)